MLSSPNALPFGLSKLLDILAPEGWGGIVQQSSSTAYQLVFPLQFSSKLGIQYVYQSPFIPFQRIYGANLPMNYTAEKEVWLEIQHRFKYVAKIIVDGFVSELPGNIHQLPTYKVDLIQNYSSIKKNYNRDRVQSLKRARRDRVDIVETDNYAETLEMHRNYILPKIEYQLVKGSYEMSFQLFEILKRLNNLLVINAYHGGKVVASAAFLVSKDLLLYYMAASTPLGRNKRAPSLIIDYVLEKFAGSGKKFDFMGSEKENLAYFKRSFGSVKSTYNQISYNNLPRPIQLLQNINRSIFQRKVTYN